jgi:tRNA-dihydrouridine synthase A
MMDYLRRRLEEGVRASSVTRHMLGLYANRPGARHWRRRLTEGAARAGATEGIIAEGLEETRRHGAGPMSGLEASLSQS